MTSRTMVETRRDGFYQNGGNTDRSGAGLSVHGTLTIDVLGATPEGGLIVRISEDAESRKTEPISLLIGKSGGISLYRPSEALSEEEIYVARMFARSFVPAERINAETKWTANSEGQNFARALNYRVERVLDDGAVALAFDGEEKMTGAHPLRTTIHGKAVYDVPKSVPRTIDMQTTARTENAGNIMTVDYSLVARLKEDVVTPRTAAPAPTPTP